MKRRALIQAMLALPLVAALPALALMPKPRLLTGEWGTVEGMRFISVSEGIIRKPDYGFVPVADYVRIS